MTLKTYNAFIAGLLLLIITPSLHAADGFVVIANKSIPEPANQQAILASFRTIFLKKKTRWPDRSKALAFSLPESHTAQQQFVSQVLEMTPMQLDDYWRLVKQTNGTTPPVEVRSERLMYRLVARTPGAFGVVSKRFIDKTSPNDVQVLFEF